MEIKLYVPAETRLEPNDQWENRFEIKSGSSGRIYIIAQNIKKRHWGCSCPGWKRVRKCKHLEELGLPIKERPYEVRLTNG